MGSFETNKTSTAPHDPQESLRQRAALRQRVSDWFDMPLGRSLQALEANQLRNILPTLYGTVAVQLGQVGKLDLMDACVAPTRILLDVVSSECNCFVRGQSEALPFDTRSVDVAILPHTLDFAVDLHQILREVQRVLSPEGHVVILGFNPLSLWGLWHLARKRRSRVPWCANFVSQSRIKDWLGLLDLELTHVSTLYHRPPLQNADVRDRLYFLDKLGGRWWPGTAAVYMLVAKKRVVGMTALQPDWERKKKLISGLTQPAARVIYPRIPQWRLHRDG